MRKVGESDWKKFKKVHAAAKERFAQQIIDESLSILNNKDRSAFERYVKLYKQITERDEAFAAIFDDYRRSTAAMCLKGMMRRNLLTEEEIAQFSPELQSFLHLDL